MDITGSANHPTSITACQPTSLRMKLHHSRRHHCRNYEEMQKFVYLLRRAMAVKLASTPMLHLSLSATRFAHRQLHLDTWSWLTHMFHSISRSIGPSALGYHHKRQADEPNCNIASLILANKFYSEFVLSYVCMYVH